MGPGIDVIGDVHGQADMLCDLLHRLEYRETGGVWRHPERTAFFIGDLIDRRPGQLEAIDIVRAMVDGESALIVMGNHEFNAVAWATPHAGRPGGFARDRTSEKNHRQHRVFLDKVGPDSQRHNDVVDWFRTLPLWVDLDGARFVHACWDPASIDVLTRIGMKGGRMTDELVIEATTPDTAAYWAIENLLKGPEIDLPDGFEYLDKDGNVRKRARFAWWRSDADTYATAAMIPPATRGVDKLPHRRLPDDHIGKRPVARYDDQVPLFVGHYWQTGETELLADRIACVDYSAAADGPLVAYRWDYKAALSADNFVSVPNSSSNA